MTAPSPLPDLPGLLADYHPQAGVADELFDGAGQMRPVWRSFIEQLASLPPEAVAARFSRGDQYLRDTGVYFRLYSGGPAQEREWPLSHVPVLISDHEWTAICAGLTQRAELLEQVMADLYGPGTLVNDGHLPGELIARSPHWLRPMVGVAPHAGHYLHHLAFEIGRSPDGSFFVLGDRTQAPSGSGFALENRMATTRIFSEPFSRSHVRRLAGYFRAFRDQMEMLAGDGRRMAILTPGPNNDAYYEHTYIARYLGLTLVEGEDLIVENGQAKVRTVRGLEPVGLLWRRIDSDFADPLELNEHSQIGTPGLIGALRQGELTLINALGSGILESRALMAFLPRICERLTGGPLAMPNIATWWCGQPAERDFVIQNAGRMAFGRALDTGLPFAPGREIAPVIGADGTLRDWIAAQGAGLVAQEAVALSTTPVWAEGRLSPHPMTIRVFAARTSSGWTFMPGGYARIGKAEDATALAMQAGGAVADVWVVAERPVPPDTMVSRTEFERAPPGILPSRAADNLYWMGRYIERCEGAIRLLRAYHLRLDESGDPAEPLLQAMAGYMADLGLGLTADAPVPPQLLDLVGAARQAAAKVRDRFSPDGWNALNDLARTTEKLAAKVVAGQDAAMAMSVLLRKISAFSGLVHENMYHFAGWRFLSLGRAQERADAMLGLAQRFADPDAPPGGYELLIEVGDSVMSHQRRYRFGPSRDTVLDLLVQDVQNPRSVVYQITQMKELVAELPAPEQLGQLSPAGRALLTLETELRVTAPADLGSEALGQMRNRLGGVFGLLSQRYFR